MVIVRPAGDEDVRAVARIHAAARRSYYRDGGYEPDPAKELGVAGWQPYLDDLIHQIVVAFITSDTEALAAGFACTIELGDDDVGLELVALYVDPGQWSQGVGSALHEWYVGQLSQSARPAGGNLEVWAGNKRARAFYQARGWLETGRHRPGPLDMPFLSLTLDRPR